MKRLVPAFVRRILRIVLTGAIGAALVIVTGLVIWLDGRPDLKIWHEAELDAEYTADGPVNSFAEYLRLESTLFNQLNAQVYDRADPADRRLSSRYHRGSLSDPERWPRNWNRTFEFPAQSPRAGLLLLHGMSDSPYSLRALGKRLHSANAWVIGLRLPGHGTAPSGLVTATWKDMAASVRLAMMHLKKKVGSRPIYLVGYSNGATLAIHYVLRALDDQSLPRVRGLALLSPSLGVTPFAAYAVWQARIGDVIGLDKLAWNSILPEYDPFKYQSFAINAGDQVYRLTTEIQRMLKAAGDAGRLERFPPVLAFQSVADGTVSAEAVLSGLFGQLPKNGHELVLFDINRHSEVESLLSHDPMDPLRPWLNRSENGFTISLVSNVSNEAPQVILRQRPPGSTKANDIDIDFEWPHDAYSLSHVALPFAADDPLYGPADIKSPGIRLGVMTLRGERGILRIPASDQLRLRWNPFYPYMEKRMMAFLQLPAPDQGP